MTAATTHSNTEDDSSLIGHNRSSSDNHYITSRQKLKKQHAYQRVGASNEVPSHTGGIMRRAPASAFNIPAIALALCSNATIAAATMAALSGVSNSSSINSSSLSSSIDSRLTPSPAAYVYVAAVAAAVASASFSNASQDNISFAYDELGGRISDVALEFTTTSEMGAINRSLLFESSLGSTVMTDGDAASAAAEEAAAAAAAADWAHFYDLILSWQGICLIAVFCTFIVITIIGNTLVILAVITTRRLKTVTNCFVMSLAVADLLVGIFVMPPAVAVHLIGSWQLGWVLCDIWISLDVLLCTASILSLCAISVDRYLAVTQPLTYSRKRRSKRLALIMILIVWVLALAITCPPMLGWYEPGRRDLSECRYNQNEGYVIFSAMGSFFIPMAVMIYVYARISCVIASRHDNMTDISVHNKKFKRYTSADVENDIDHDCSEQDHSSMQQKKQAAARTFSNQTLAKELHEVMLSEGDNGSGEGSRCHSLLTLPMGASSGATSGGGKNGCYELTRPSSLRRTPTASSTMTTMTSGCGMGGVSAPCGSEHQQQPQQTPQWTTRSHSVRLQQTATPAAHPHHHHLSAPPMAGAHVAINSPNSGGTNILVTSPNMQHTTTLLRHGGRTVAHHHHHTKSLSNRITSLKKENKTTQTLSIVVGGFIACWLPFFVYYLITPFLEEHQVSRTLAKVLTWLGWFNSAINPFIYAFYSVDFRAAFWRLTCKRFFSSSSMKPQFPTNTMSIRR